MRLYRAFNGATALTAAPVKVTTGTAIKTLMQISTPATLQITVKAWGISFDGSAAATPIECELVDCNVAATVTAYVAADIAKFSAPNDIASQITLGTANSGYTASAEGATTISRILDAQLVAPTNQYLYQFPLGEEPIVAAGLFLRVRVTAAAAVNAYCWVLWGE